MLRSAAEAPAMPGTKKPEAVILAKVPQYVTVDSAPTGFAVRRAAWVAPVFLLAFTGASVAILPLFPALTASYARALGKLTDVPASELAQQGSLSFRPFFALLMLLVSAFAAGSLKARLRMLLFSWVIYVPLLLLVDIALVTTASWGAPPPLSNAGGIAAGCVGLLVIVGVTFTQYRLPPNVTVRARRRRSLGYSLVLPCSAAVSIIVAVIALRFRAENLDALEGIPILGGFSSVVVLFLLTLTFMLYVLSAVQRRRRPTDGPMLSVAFLVPAHNEALEIAECIRALDAAATNYPGLCRLYVVDNASTDGTSEVAIKAVAKCRALQGRVLQCPERGKSHAMNLGIRHMSEDLVVRVDADTIVLPTFLQKTVPHFWDPSVGGASGLPLPKNPSSWLGRLRTIEVYYGVAFLRVGHGAMDAVMVLPGMAAAYRRELLEELGGFGIGFNGEDADITMRMGRLGYRIVTDPGIQLMTDVPDLPHLREQRQRWARGLFHMAARNMSAIRMRQGARAMWLLPWAILNSSRRCLMIPILTCAGAVELVDPTVFSLREISVIGGFVVGVQLLVITAILLAHRKFEAIPVIPSYLVFRIFRAYIALETLLSLQLNTSGKVEGAVASDDVTLPSPRLVQKSKELEIGMLFSTLELERQSRREAEVSLNALVRKTHQAALVRLRMMETIEKLNVAPDGTSAAEADFVLFLAELEQNGRPSIQRQARMDTLIREMREVVRESRLQQSRHTVG